MSTLSASAALAPQQRDCDHANDVNNNTQDATNNSNNNSDNEQQHLIDEADDRIMHLSEAKEVSSNELAAINMLGDCQSTDSIVVDEDDENVAERLDDDSENDDDDVGPSYSKTASSSINQTGLGFSDCATNDSLQHNLSQPPNNNNNNNNINNNLLCEQETPRQRQHSEHKQLELDQSTTVAYKSNNNIEQMPATATNDTNLNEISANCKIMHNNSQGAINAQMHACRLCDKLLSSSSSLDRHMLTHSGDRPFVCKRCHMTFTTNGNMHRHMRTHLHKDSLARQQLEQQFKSSITPGAISSGSNSPAPNPMAASAAQQQSPSLLSALSSCNSRELVIENSNSKTSTNNLATAADSNQSIASEPTIESLTSSSVAAAMASNGASLIAPLLTPDTIMAATAATQPQSGAVVDGNAMTALLNQLLIAALSHQQQQQSSSPAAQQLDQTAQEIERVTDPLESVETESIKSNHSQQQHHSQQHITMATDVPPITTAASTTSTAAPQTNCLLLQQPIRVSTTVANEQSSPSYYLSSAATSSTSSPITSPNHSHSAVAQSLSSSTPMSTNSHHNVWPNHSQQITMADDTNTTSSNTFQQQQQQHQQQQQQQQQVVEDISQSYVKTANPNAARKGGKRNRHCYKCKLCTYSSVDRCTLVRHLRIHSGERPYICGICRYAFTTKANCERHVRKRHKKQYNSLGGAGGVKGGNGGGRSLIITDHNNHQTIPVKVNPVAAQTISQTLQKIQEKQQDNEFDNDDVVVDKGLNKNSPIEPQQQFQPQQPPSHASSFTFEQNSHCTRQMMNNNDRTHSPSIIQSRSQSSGSRKRKQNGQLRVANNLKSQMLAEQLTQANLQQTINPMVPQHRDSEDDLRHDKEVIDDVFRSKKLLASATNQPLQQPTQEPQLLPAGGAVRGQAPNSVASLLFNQHMGPIANAIEMLSSAKHLSQHLALDPQNSFTNLLHQTPFNPIDLAAQALDLSCKPKTTE